MAPLLPAVILIVVRAAVLATPAEPLWIKGLYDGADFDDAVRAVSFAAVPTTASASIVRPEPIPGGNTPLAVPSRFRVHTSERQRPRSPPLRSALLGERPNPAAPVQPA